MRRHCVLLVLLGVLLVPILAEGQGRTVSHTQNVRDEVWGDYCDFDPVTWSYHCISVTAYSTDDWITGEVLAYLSFYDDLVGYGACEVSPDTFGVEDLQSVCGPLSSRPIMVTSLVISGVMHMVCFIGMPDMENSHNPGLIAPS